MDEMEGTVLGDCRRVLSLQFGLRCFWRRLWRCTRLESGD